MEEYRQTLGSPEGRSLDLGNGLGGVEAQAGQPVEDRLEADPQLESGEVHTEADVPSPTECQVGRAGGRFGFQLSASAWTCSSRLAEPIETDTRVP